MRVKLIVNPEAGRGRIKKWLPEIERKLKDNGCEVDSFITKKRGDAMVEAARSQASYPEVIAVVGGDGTVNEVVNGILGAGFKPVPTLGIIPLGTVNLFAKELGIPENPIEACDVIFKGNIKEFDLGKAGDYYFTSVAGVGFDAQVVKSVTPQMKKLLGTSSYLFAVIKTLIVYKLHTISIEIDGGIKKKGYIAIISNTKRYAGERIRVTPDADVRNGLLDICIFKKGKRLDILRYLLGILTRRHMNYSDVESLKAKKLKITGNKQVLVHTDCEILPIPVVGMEFTILPRALKIMVP